MRSIFIEWDKKITLGVFRDGATVSVEITLAEG